MTESAHGPSYRYRAWWIPATIGAVAVVSAVQVTALLAWLNKSPVDAGTGWFLVAHVIAAVVSTALFTAVRSVRGAAPQSLRYSERYLVGLGYGIVTSLFTCVAAGALLAESFGQAVEYAGLFMTASLFSMELPVACIVGGLTWHLITKVRQGVPVPVRPRRPIEDAQ